MATGARKMTQCVVYLRVSSKEQKEEGYSIPAQEKLLRAYARKHGFSVVEVYEEVETAKRAGRREFERMVRFLKANRGIKHILVEKTDRLYRNFRDLVAADELGRSIHFVKEGQVIGPDARSSDKLNHDLKVVLAKNYIDNLSEETRKGMVEKAEQGLYPSYAPLGYVNDRESHGLGVDFERAAIIRELFETYGKGGVSLRELSKIAHRKGLRTRKGKPLHKSAIAKMLSNPVYIGDMMWKGVYYQGKHDPIVSVEVFERVKRLLHGKGHAKKRRVFAYRGLLRCGNCGCLITAEIKKERYVYYRCTRGRKNCTEKPVREEALEKVTR